jgi:hypothetical protein
MPGFKTHSIFGKIIADKLNNNSIKKRIGAHEAVFQMGNQGPDFLFYYVPAHLMIHDNPGDVLHNKRVNLMFKTLLQLRSEFSGYDLDIVDSYIAGFFGHYLLDSKLHPYIYYRTNHLRHEGEITYDFGNHSLLETDIDQYVCDHYLHVKAIDYRPWEKIAMSLRERHVVSKLMYLSISRVYPNLRCSEYTVSRAMYFMMLEQRLMYDRHGVKKNLLRIVDKFTVNHTFLSALVPYSNRGAYFPDPCNEARRKWLNPWNAGTSQKASVYDLIFVAAKDYNTILELYNDYISGKETDYTELLKKLGNKSYLTGLNIK